MRNEGYDYSEQIGSPQSGATVASYLAARYTHSTREQWLERIRSGQVTVDGQAADPDTTLREGQELTWRRPPWLEPDVPTSYGIVHEDEHVLGVDKPAGLPTAAAGGFLRNTLLSLVRQREPRAVPLHRLGRWTSGLVLFARTRQARSALSEAWRTGRVLRRYRALARGNPSSTEFVIDSPIGRVPHPLLDGLHATSPRGKPARTIVRVLEVRGDHFLAEVSLETGKPHQIRIHLATAGYPLVGDPLYVAGGGADPARPALPGDPGYHLHAMHLRFPHPATGIEIDVFCPPPPSLAI